MGALGCQRRPWTSHHVVRGQPLSGRRGSSHGGCSGGHLSGARLRLQGFAAEDKIKHSLEFVTESALVQVVEVVFFVFFSFVSVFGFRFSGPV